MPEEFSSVRQVLVYIKSLLTVGVSSNFHCRHLTQQRLQGLSFLHEHRIAHRVCRSSVITQIFLTAPSSGYSRPQRPREWVLPRVGRTRVRRHHQGTSGLFRPCVLFVRLRPRHPIPSQRLVERVSPPVVRRRAWNF